MLIAVVLPRECIVPGAVTPGYSLCFWAFESRFCFLGPMRLHVPVSVEGAAKSAVAITVPKTRVLTRWSSRRDRI